MIELTENNYYEPETDIEYMSFSQFVDFTKCEAKALAKAEGRYVQETTDAMLQGSYVDAYFSNELERFKTKHPEIFNKNGTLSAKFTLCDRIIESIQSDKGFHDAFYKGDAQQIITFEVAGVPFKAKLDFLQDDKIVDMKCMRAPDKIEYDEETKTFRLLNWSDEFRKFVPFWLPYRYDIQAALYQEAVFQKTGKRLPYYLAVATKESPSKLFAFRFDQEILDDALELVKANAPRYQQIKKHEIEPTECGRCDYFWNNRKFDMTFDVCLIQREEE